MIARIWRGTTRADQADAYMDYRNATGIKAYRATPGNRDVLVLRRIENDEAEFTLISLWESKDLKLW